MLQSSGFRKYLTQTSWLLVDRVLRLVSTLAVGILITRYLGAERMGQWNYAGALVGLFSFLTYLGLNEIMVRDLVRHPLRRQELMGTGLLLQVLGTALLLVSVMAIAVWKDVRTDTLWLVLMLALSEMLKPAMVFEYYYMAEVRGKVIAQLNIVQTLVGAALKVALVLCGAHLVLFGAALIVENGVWALLLVRRYQVEGQVLSAFRATRRMAVLLLKQAWPVVVYGIALNLQLKVDQVMLFDILSRLNSEEIANNVVGQYGVAVKMVEAASILPVILQASFAPAIARAKVQDPALYESRMINLYRLMFLLCVITAVPLYFVAEPAIVLLYGEEFRYAGALLAMFSIRLIFPFMGVAKTSFITNEGLFKYSLLTAVVGAVINVGMNYVLIPLMGAVDPQKGAEGALWATMVSFVVGIFLMDLFYEKTRRNFRWMVGAMMSFWRLRGVS
jgi:O-antigen/teichoic acid export membrane protein